MKLYNSSDIRSYIFSTPMVQALLNTKPNTWPAEPIDPSKPFKWMTRRVVKPQPDKDDPCIAYCTAEGYPSVCAHISSAASGKHWGESIKLKTYSIGDILWVRETFTKAPNGEYIYRADPVFDGCGKGDFAWNWTSSIFMPREASRITLEVKDVRVERVQRIGYEDIVAEGISFEDNEDFEMAEHYMIGGSPVEGGTPERFAFAALWDTLNAKRGYSWESNPYVFVYEFMRIKC